MLHGKYPVESSGYTIIKEHLCSEEEYNLQRNGDREMKGVALMPVWANQLWSGLDAPAFSPTISQTWTTGKSG